MHSRQEPLRLLRRACVLISPSSHRQGRGQEMAVRGSRGSSWRKVWRWLPGWIWRKLAQCAPGEHQLHDTVPCHRTSIPNEVGRQDESGQDGAAVLRSRRSQEPRCDGAPGQVSHKACGGGPQPAKGRNFQKFNGRVADNMCSL
jgi:hypothetical protein